MNSSELLRDDFHLGKIGQSLDFLPFEKNSLWKFLKEEKKLLGSDLREQPDRWLYIFFFIGITKDFTIIVNPFKNW